MSGDPKKASLLPPVQVLKFKGEFMPLNLNGSFYPTFTSDQRRYSAAYADTPDTTGTEGAVARQVAIDSPMLMLIRQNGDEDKGWRGTAFYWPVIVAQQNIRTAIFAHETTP